ncbi:hypothetical protein GE09DRAFT_1077111 [Coniochaeta sp. 2T2.1]|nr:hypothetical protein GE09DRAFT_1077111 [Coniochaeta sp. 2T2.1]
MVDSLQSHGVSRTSVTIVALLSSARATLQAINEYRWAAYTSWTRPLDQNGERYRVADRSRTQRAGVEIETNECIGIV